MLDNVWSIFCFQDTDESFSNRNLLVSYNVALQRLVLFVFEIILFVRVNITTESCVTALTENCITTATSVRGGMKLTVNNLRVKCKIFMKLRAAIQ